MFHALDAKHIESIARIQLKVLEQRLEKMDMKLDVSAEALAEIAKVGFDPVFGARPLKRAIQQRIENPRSQADPRGPVRPEGRDAGRLQEGRIRVRACGASTHPRSGLAAASPPGGNTRGPAKPDPRCSLGFDCQSERPQAADALS